jgi:hypothetical protein
VRRETGVERATEVALVPDVGHKAGKRLAEPRDAKCFGTHVRASNAGADIGRRADEADGELLHRAKLTAGNRVLARLLVSVRACMALILGRKRHVRRTSYRAE